MGEGDEVRKVLGQERRRGGWHGALATARVALVLVGAGTPAVGRVTVEGVLTEGTAEPARGAWKGGGGSGGLVALLSGHGQGPKADAVGVEAGLPLD